MARYDEDLHENQFFQTLRNKFGPLFNKAAENRWTIFVPRADSVSRLKLTKADFENHVVIPMEKAGHFTSVNGKSVLVEGGAVIAGRGYKEQRAVKILFDESFFNSRDESHEVFCVDQPLEGALSEEMVLSLENVEDCIKYLWGEPGSEKVRRLADRLLGVFSLQRNSSIRLILDTTMALYTRVVQEVYKLKKFQSSSQNAFCKLAVETYVLAALHKKIFKTICFKIASKDSSINKITRNLSDITPQSLGIRPEFQSGVSKARAVLSQLNQFPTPLEKLYCFKSCVSTLAAGGSQEHLTADELLPILVYLVIVTDIPNWRGNLVYMSRFHFSQVATEEFTFYMTSFEAAVEYIRNDSQEIDSLTSGISKETVQRLRSNSLHDDRVDFFTSVCSGEVDVIRSLLQREAADKDGIKDRLCHPLCTCPECTRLLDRQLDDSDRASVFSRDTNGRTGLHHAARLGHSTLASLLLEHGAILTATDLHSSTPLHLACQKGHQKVTLLLLGESANLNATDNHGNTPLHLACSNGHEECAKALLFNKDKCRVNATNDQGDTPLHNAARWGYASIVGVLLTHGASTTVLNRRRESPQQCAQSGKVQHLLSSAQSVKGGVADSDSSDDTTPVMRPSQVSRRMTVRGSYSEPDRQLKRLFRAVQDGDTNYVKYLFGWEEGSENRCHPLCQCDRCVQVRKSPPMSILSINSCDPQGQTPLHKACLLGHTKMVEVLLAHKALPDVRARESQQTPLHLACQYNHQDVVLLLLEEGASVNVQDFQGNTPLHFSCTNGHLDTALLLLARGADVTVANYRGDSALHNAARWNHAPLVQVLMLYGAQYKATNNEEKTPLDLTKDEEVQKLVLMAISGELMVGRYTTPLTSSPPAPITPTLTTSTPPVTTSNDESTPRGQTPTPLFPVEEDELFSTSDDPTPSSSHPSSPSHTSYSNRDIRELLKAIESFDRRGTLRRTSTLDRSAPLLRETTPTIPVPTTPPKEDHPGGSWENVQTAPPPEPLGQSWDCVREIDVMNSLSLEHTLTQQ